MTVGAPPDEFFDEGQDWGFPPQLPGAGRRSGHALWQRLVARAGEHASLLRIDHVMGVQRLWWIPEGAGAQRRRVRALPARGVAGRHRRRGRADPARRSSARTSARCPRRSSRRSSDGTSSGSTRSSSTCTTTAPGRWTRSRAASVAGIRTHDMPAFVAAFEGDATGAVYAYRRASPRPSGIRSVTRPPTCSTPPSSGSPASDAYLVVADLDDLVERDRAAQRARGRCCTRRGGVDYAGRHRACSPTATSVAGSSC